MGLLLVAALSLAGSLLWIAAPPQRRRPSGATWGCGYLAPTLAMQYTSSSFAQMLVGMFGWVLRPRIAPAKRLAAVPAAGRLPQRRARRGARRGGAAGVPFGGLAVSRGSACFSRGTSRLTCCISSSP